MSSLLAVVLLGAATAPPVLSTNELTAPRVRASVLAVVVIEVLIIAISGEILRQIRARAKSAGSIQR